MTSGIVTSAFRRDGAAAGMAASERIRQRLTDTGHRFHANDNIAAFLRPGELDELRSEVEARMQEVLSALVCTAPGSLDGRLHYAAHGRFWSSHL